MYSKYRKGRSIHGVLFDSHCHVELDIHAHGDLLFRYCGHIEWNSQTEISKSSDHDRFSILVHVLCHVSRESHLETWFEPLQEAKRALSFQHPLTEQDDAPKTLTHCGVENLSYPEH